MASAADALAIANGVLGQDGAAPAAGPITLPSGAPFNAAEWTPAPGVNPQTNLPDPSLPTNGFVNQRGDWMQSLPAASGPNQGTGAAPSPAADPNGIAAKTAIAQGVLSGDIKAPPEPPAPATVSSVAGNVGAGANDAIAGTLGAPVDLATWAMNLLPRGVNAVAGTEIPQIQSPIGGSDSFKSLMGLIGADPRDVEANNAAERIGRGTGGGIASMLLPFGAARTVAGLAPIANPALRSIPRTLIDSMGGGTLKTTATTGGTAGAGGGIADEVTPEPYKPLANFAGQVAGGGVMSAIEHGLGSLAQAGGNYLKQYFRPFTAGGRDQIVGGQLRAASSDPNAIPNMDVGNSQIVPGSKPTTYQLTGDQGLGGAERAAMTANPEPFNVRRSDQNAARLTAVDSTAQGQPGAVGTALRAQLAELDARTGAVVDNARASGARAVQSLGGSRSETQAGAALRPHLDAAKRAAKAHEGRLWRAIDPDGRLVVDASPVARAAEHIRGEMARSSKPMEGEEAAVMGIASLAGRGHSFNELTALRGRVLSAMREERFKNGQSPALRRLTMLSEAIDNTIEHTANDQAARPNGVSLPEIPSIQGDVRAWYAARHAAEAASDAGAGSADLRGAAGGGSSAVPRVGRAASTPAGGPRGGAVDSGIPPAPPPLETNFGPEDAQRYRSAAHATRTRSRTFGGVVGDVLRNGSNGEPYRIADSQVAEKFFNSGGHAFEDVTRFLGAVGGRPQAVQILQDYAASSLRAAAENADGTLDAGKFAKWMTKHADAMRVFPELAERFDSAAGAQRWLERATAGRQRAMETYQNGAARHFLGDVDPRDAVKKALNAGDRDAAFAELGHLTAGNPDARAGLQRAVVELIQRDLIGNTEAGTSGGMQLKSDQFQTFMKRNRGALGFVFSQEQLASLEAVASDLNRANRSISGAKLPGQSNTAQDTASVAKHMVHQAGQHGGTLSVIAALLVERLSDNLALAVPLGVAGVGAKLLSVMRANGLAKVDDLITQALLDPALARDLLTKLKPGGPDRFTLETLGARLRTLSGVAAVRTADR